MLGGLGKLCAACGFVGVIGEARWFAFSVFLGMSGQSSGQSSDERREVREAGGDQHWSMAALKWQSFAARGRIWPP